METSKKKVTPKASAAKDQKALERQLKREALQKFEHKRLENIAAAKQENDAEQAHQHEIIAPSYGKDGINQHPAM